VSKNWVVIARQVATRAQAKSLSRGALSPCAASAASARNSAAICGVAAVSTMMRSLIAHRSSKSMLPRIESLAHQRKSGRSTTSSGEAIEASCRSLAALASTMTHSKRTAGRPLLAGCSSKTSLTSSPPCASGRSGSATRMVARDG
jgi:hypothetical protein